MILTIDHLSVWEIAHRWHDADPNRTDPAALPLPVQDTLRTLAWALVQEELHVLNESGVMYPLPAELPTLDEFIPPQLLKTSQSVVEELGEGVTKMRLNLERMTPEEAGVAEEEIDEAEEYERFVDRRLRRYWAAIEGLERCYRYREYDKSKFESVHLDKEELFRYCRREGIEPPAFWYTENDRQRLAGSNPAEKQPKPRANQLARERCRAIAQTLWHFDADMTITAICRHPAFVRFGSGGHYQEKTCREWIKDLDPRPPEKKRGRPKNRDR